MELTDLIQHITLNEPHFMWFLGAGAPRSAGLPTAYNIIWDLKRRYYALHENAGFRTDTELTTPKAMAGIIRRSKGK